MFLLMLTVTVLFGTLSLGFLWAPNRGAYEVPWLFYLNTLMLGFSSFFLHRGWQLRIQGQARPYLRLAVITGGLFLVSQVIAYVQLYDAGYLIEESGRKMQFLYILSGLHALHLIAGVILLGVVLFRYEQSGRRLFEVSMYFWHFLGVLWVYLLAVLLLAL